MIFDTDFPSKVKRLLEGEDTVFLDGKHSLFLCRNDGVLLYSRTDIDSPDSEMSIGALLGGLWQAAEALSLFIPGKHSCHDFRLSFDTSNKGIYVVPLEYMGKSYYLGIIYLNEVNPGLLKSKVRALAKKLEINLVNNAKKSEKELSDGATDCTSKNDFLFEDISDDEVDELFSFAGN